MSTPNDIRIQGKKISARLLDAIVPLEGFGL